MDRYDAIVLAGGRSERMGRDKTTLRVGGARLLDRALGAVRDAQRIVVVGPKRRIAAPPRGELIWTTERPRFAGPAAAIARGIRTLDGEGRLSPGANAGEFPDRADVVVVLAVDHPFAAAAVPRLIEALAPGVDAAMLTDSDGRRQPLLAAYRRSALRAAVADGDWLNRSVRALVADLRVVEVSGREGEILDCDTPEALHEARRIDRRSGG
ncbi:MAG: NTP transferase domain-containing protein [Acidothermus sp.]|nr:NTP transferase domain-containing protein [Acidothermus sp.]MCL6537243.1 NTP transferase domain-containing protein [Acidothermus sp.]